jgi:hypothetical protein
MANELKDVSYLETGNQWSSSKQPGVGLGTDPTRSPSSSCVHSGLGKALDLVGDGRYHRWPNGGAVRWPTSPSWCSPIRVPITTRLASITRRHNGDFNFQQIVRFNTIRISSLDHATLIIHHEKFIPKLAKFQLNSTTNVSIWKPLGNW